MFSTFSRLKVRIGRTKLLCNSYFDILLCVAKILHTSGDPSFSSRLMVESDLGLNIGKYLFNTHIDTDFLSHYFSPRKLCGGGGGGNQGTREEITAQREIINSLPLNKNHEEGPFKLMCFVDSF